MAAVELGGYVHGQVAVAQRAMRGLGIGRGGGEIAAHREEHLAAPVQHRLDRTNGVEAVLARRLEAEYLLPPVQACRRWPLEDRSEERRVGNERGSTCRSRGPPSP